MQVDLGWPPTEWKDGRARNLPVKDLTHHARRQQHQSDRHDWRLILLEVRQTDRQTAGQEVSMGPNSTKMYIRKERKSQKVKGSGR